MQAFSLHCMMLLAASVASTLLPEATLTVALVTLIFPRTLELHLPNILSPLHGVPVVAAI